MSEQAYQSTTENTTRGATGTGYREPYFTEFGNELRKAMRGMLPSDQVVAHFRTARIEFLKGLRQIIDDRIDSINRTGQKGTRVSVD